MVLSRFRARQGKAPPSAWSFLRRWNMDSFFDRRWVLPGPGVLAPRRWPRYAPGLLALAGLLGASSCGFKMFQKTPPRPFLPPVIAVAAPEPIPLNLPSPQPP